jgi:hypothetical protein
MLKSYRSRVLRLVSVFVLLLSIFQLCGCSSRYQQVRTDGFSPPSKLDVRNCSVYISTPSDGSYGGTLYPNSGRMTAQALKSAFSKKVARVKVSTAPETHETGLNNARSQNFSHYLWPDILHWEERATEWSGRPDRIEVKIELVRVDDAKAVDSVIIKGSSKWATFGGDHPQDLLPKPFNSYVSSIFR